MGELIEVLSPVEAQSLTVAVGSPGGDGVYADSMTSTERGLAEVLADVMHVEQVSIDSRFFDDLGADSLVMAHFCARARKRSERPSVSIKDVYRSRAVRSLAEALAGEAPAPAGASLATVRSAVAPVVGAGFSAWRGPAPSGVEPAGKALVPPLSTPRRLVFGLVQARWFYRDAFIFSTCVFAGLAVFGLLFAGTVPRLLNKLIQPGKIYPLYGFQYWAHRSIARATNIRFFMTLFGDTSYIVHYLRWIGYKLTPVVQTGCNFGMEVKSENPYLTSVGTGTVIADGLSIMNSDFSSTSFRVSPASIGSHNFVGNAVVYPAQGRTGDNCLLATKVGIPVDGEVRTNTGVLGSGSLDIPRSVQRDTSMAHLDQGEQRRALVAINRYDLGGMGLFLLAWWFLFFVMSLVLLATADLYGPLGELVIAGVGVVSLLFGTLYLVVVERRVSGFRRLQPQYCSIYDPYFWWHERFWKLSTNPKLLDGTPFKNLAWRLLGVRLGARILDDGCAIIEKTLTTVGDGCVLNAGSRIQGHSQEDGAVKSDHITIGAGGTLGVGSLVHYGVAMGDGAVLAPDSFLMKGTDVPSRALWGGNPARKINANSSVLVGGK